MLERSKTREMSLAIETVFLLKEFNSGGGGWKSGGRMKLLTASQGQRGEGFNSVLLKGDVLVYTFIMG